MTYNKLTCGSNAGNTGLQNCNEDFGRWQKLLLVDAGFEIDTQANGLLEATYTTAINAAIATRMYPLFEHFNAEIDQEESVKEDGWGGMSETVREGKDKVTFMFKDVSLHNHHELRKHNDRTNLACYIITAQGYILGRTTNTITGVKFLPLTLSEFDAGKRNISDGSNKDRSNVFIEFADASQWNDLGVALNPTDWDPLLLGGIKDLSITGTLGATTETVTVEGWSDSVGFAGLIAANFSLVDDLAPTVLIPVVVATDNGDGTYVLTHASITGAHTMTLIDQPIGTNGAEALNSIETTV